MKRPSPKSRVRRTFVLGLLSFIAVASLLVLVVSAKRAHEARALSVGIASPANSVPDAALKHTQNQKPLAPTAAVIVATLTDNITAATKVAPGGTINYTATITNNGAASPADDATNLNFSAPLDANTTLIANSVHASPIARNDTYNWVGNTQLDTAARALPAVISNDVAVNAPAGTDTFTVTAIAGGPTALGGTVTLASPSGAFTYTPPVGRPNIADGASVNDTFTYTITNSADPSLTSTGTVTITLTGRVWYLQAGAAGDGRSNTPSSSPAAMSTAADKSTDVFYIFSNAAALNGPFSVDAGQQLLGQGVNLVVSSITLFTAAAPTPSTTNTAGNCVALAGAPGNNTLSGFNIGNCTGGTAITGANVGTINVSTMTINTNGGALDLTGVGTPTVSVVLGGTTSTAGAKNVNLVGLNGTFTLASGALSGATGNGFDVNGGNATITYSGTISNSGAKQVNIANKTSGSVTLDGAVNGTGTGINLATNATATMTFRGGVVLSTGANAAFSATGGGTVNVCDENPCNPGATGALVNTLSTTTGTALNVVNTTIGANNLEFRSIAAGTGAGSAGDGIILDTTGGTGGLKVTGTGSAGSGGTIQHKTGADGSTTNGIGIYLNSTSNVSFSWMQLNDFDNFAIRGIAVNNLTMDHIVVTGNNGTNGAIDEGSVIFGYATSPDATSALTGSVSVTNSSFGVTGNSIEDTFRVRNGNGTLNRITFTNDTFACLNTTGDALNFEEANAAIVNVTVQNSTFTSAPGDLFQFNPNGSGNTDLIFTGNTLSNNNPAIATGGGGVSILNNGQSNFTFNIANSTFRDAVGQGLLMVHSSAGNASMVGTITNNMIGATGVANSGSLEGDAIKLQMVGAVGAAGGTFKTTLTGNTIQQYNNFGIDLLCGGGAPGIHQGTFETIITGNTIGPLGTNTAAAQSQGIGLNGGTNVGDIFAIYVEIGGTAAADKNTVNNWTATNGLDDIRLRQRQATTVHLTTKNGAGTTNYGGANNDNAAVVTFIQANNTTTGHNSATNTVPTGGGFIGGAPPIPNPVDETVHNRIDEGLNSNPATFAMARVEADSMVTPVAPVLVSVPPARPDYGATLGNFMYHAFSRLSGAAHTVDSIITPTAYAQDPVPNAPTSGEVVSLNTIATFPAGGKSITIKYSATVNTPPLARQVSTQGTVTAAGGISVVTDDPEPAGGPQATVTLVDTLMTWNGSTSTDWNTITNWTQPAGGTQYAPGVSNPAINDVVIPNVGAQPNISSTDIGVFSLNISNGRTLTITSPRVLTIGGSPGGDLTLDGIISGGNLNLGTGTHVINNAGGTGSLSSTNVATVLSGGTVTLNNNLQAGALAVNAGGSMVITNRTLSLNGSGAALTIPGGATFTTTGSTVIFNGTVAQQAAGIAYNNLTINNTIGLNVTGVTLTGNATINGTLTLTSSDLDTGAFTLMQPNTTASTGVSDVVGTVSRTGGPFAIGTPLTFGNPNNILTITAGATRPTAVTFGIAKAAPANPNGYAAAVQRTYTISQTAGTGFTSTLRLHYLDSELNGNTEASLNLRRLRTSDNHWTVHLPTTVDGVNNWVQSTGVLDTELSTRWTMSSLAPTASNGVVTGRITDAQGKPVEGAVVRLSGAQERKFITDANGNYRFDNVETGGFYTVTPARANYNFNPFNRSFSQTGNQTQAGFTATSMGDNANPLDTAEYYVRQQYVDVLSREPEEAGFNYWSDRILGCAEDAQCVNTQRREVAAAFFISEENQATGSYLYDVYSGSLGRRPAFGEFSTDRTQVVGGETLDTAKTVFAQHFVQRAEFVARYQNAMTADAFVEALIQGVQSSGVDLSSERANLIDIYGQAAGNLATNRAAVLRAVADNATFKQSQYNQAFVLTEYFAYLRRDAENDGFNFWVGVLNTGDVGNYRGMVCSFVTSTEYQNRFSQVVSHSNGECGQ